MKTLHEFHDMLTKALDAIEQRDEAQEQALAAQRAAMQAQNSRFEAIEAAKKTKAEADTEVKRLQVAALDLAAKMQRERDAHKTATEKAAADAKTATDAASETLEGINRQIAEGKAELAKLTTAKARIRAEIADALKADGE